jgi:hypothetical protein
MTPEQLEAIPGIGPRMVERIQIAVNSYYQQFEEALTVDQPDGTAQPPADAPAVTAEQAPAAENVAAEPGADMAVTPPDEAAAPAGSVEPAGESDTIKDSD